MTLTRCERLRDCTEWDWVIQCSASQSLYFQLSLLSDVSISIHFECIWYIELYQFQDVPKYQHFDAQLTDSLAWFSVRLQHSQDKFVRVAPTDWGNELWDFMELQKFWNCEILNPCCFQISKTYFILDQKLVRHGTLLPCCVGHPARLLCGRALRCGGSGNWHPAAWGKSRLKRAGKRWVRCVTQRREDSDPTFSGLELLDMKTESRCMVNGGRLKAGLSYS